MATRLIPHTSLESLLRQVRRREWAIVGTLGFAWIVVLAMVSWRLAGGWAVLGVLVLSGSPLLLHARSRTRSLDTGWLTRTLDAAIPQLQDSSALLDSENRSGGDLQRLQADRVRSIFAWIEPPELRRAWPRRSLALSYALAAASLLLPWADSMPPSEITSSATSGVGAASDRPDEDPRIADVQLTIRPPAYTGLPVRTVDTIGTRAPMGSALRWSLRVTPVVNSLVLATHDGRALPFAFRQGAWHGGTTLARSMLVRAQAKGARLDPRLHRIEAVPDRAPRVRVIRPLRTLSLAAPGQRQFELVFQANDDYGIAKATLVVTLAQGSGENIGVRTQTLAIPGSGAPRSKRFVASLDLAALGMQPGDDLIAQLHVVDSRQPRAQTARSASAILRWPLPPSKDQSSMDGVVQRVLPAYFRSQRQIIIDSEALLAQRAGLARDDFVTRSDAIGVDQRLLRLRYGQFLGEEGGDDPHSPGGESTGVGPPVASDPAKNSSSSSSSSSSLFADAHAHVENGEPGASEGTETAPPPSPGQPHDDAPQGPAAAFGDSLSVIDEFGHTHDIPEAATLLDPATQKLLRAALGEMWQAELHLRQGFPQRALPFENRALELIKEVQQADRIYLAKVGSEIPPVEEARRLTGKRDGLKDRRDTLEAAPAQQVAISALWSALGQTSRRPGDAVLAPLLADAEVWLTSRRVPSTQVLDAIAAIDAVRIEPECSPCRRKLRASLWVLLPRSVAGVPRRDSADSEQRAYLEALARERQR